MDHAIPIRLITGRFQLVIPGLLCAVKACLEGKADAVLQIERGSNELAKNTRSGPL